MLFLAVGWASAGAGQEVVHLHATSVRWGDSANSYGKPPSQGSCGRGLLPVPGIRCWPFRNVAPGTWVSSQPGCLPLTGKPLERDGPPLAPWWMEGFLLSSARQEERVPALLDPTQSQDLPGAPFLQGLAETHQGLLALRTPSWDPKAKSWPSIPRTMSLMGRMGFQDEGEARPPLL